MGRRKIQIEAISNERNRSVTFLKRKNGLFKKAYELGVLCSCDVAVIILETKPGHGERLHQYSSINDVGKILKKFAKHRGEKEIRTPADFTTGSIVSAKSKANRARLAAAAAAVSSSKTADEADGSSDTDDDDGDDDDDDEDDEEEMVLAVEGDLPSVKEQPVLEQRPPKRAPEPSPSSSSSHKRPRYPSPPRSYPSPPMPSVIFGPPLSHQLRQRESERQRQMMLLRQLEQRNLSLLGQQTADDPEQVDRMFASFLDAARAFQATRRSGERERYSERLPHVNNMGMGLNVDIPMGMEWPVHSSRDLPPPPPAHTPDWFSFLADPPVPHHNPHNQNHPDPSRSRPHLNLNTTNEPSFEDEDFNFLRSLADFDGSAAGSGFSGESS